MYRSRKDRRLQTDLWRLWCWTDKLRCFFLFFQYCVNRQPLSINFFSLYRDLIGRVQKRRHRRVGHWVYGQSQRSGSAFGETSRSACAAWRGEQLSKSNGHQPRSWVNPTQLVSFSIYRGVGKIFYWQGRLLHSFPSSSLSLSFPFLIFPFPLLLIPVPCK